MVIDTVSFTVTAPGAGPTAMAAVAGDSAIVRNGRANTAILALAMFSTAQAAGFTQVLWPSGHDLVRGLRYRNTALRPDNHTTPNFPPRFRSQDPLTVSQSGSAVAGDVELVSLMMFYDDLPGVDGQFINNAALMKRGINAFTIDDTVTPTAASTYSGARAINTGSDLLQADTDYAILGASFGAVVGAHCLTIRGVDNGNLRLPIPAQTDSNENAGFFTEISMRTGLACIPVFNSANRGGTFLEILGNENFAAVTVSLHVVQLKK